MLFFGFDRTMGCSREDLARWLREFTGSDHGMADTGQARLQFDWGALSIQTEPAPPRALGLVRFHDLRVRFTPSPGAEQPARDWLMAFDRHTQRGGG